MCVQFGFRHLAVKVQKDLSNFPANKTVKNAKGMGGRQFPSRLCDGRGRLRLRTRDTKFKQSQLKS